MNINNTVATSTQACLHKGIVFCKIGWVERPIDHVFGQILPRNGQSVDVEAIVLREVLHLAGPIASAVLGKWRISIVGVPCALRQKSVGVHCCPEVQYTYGSINAKVESSTVSARTIIVVDQRKGGVTQQCLCPQTAPEQEPSPRSKQRSSQQVFLRAYRKE